LYYIYFYFFQFEHFILGGYMTIVEMLGQSGILTVLGMGVVFLFLVIMVICVNITGKIIHAIGADKDVYPPESGNSEQTANPVKTTAVAAAITAAVTEYQKDNS
jgi:oxaloacetate decarboxylase gamma subunit